MKKIKKSILVFVLAIIFSVFTLRAYANDLLVTSLFSKEIVRIDQQTGGLINTFVSLDPTQSPWGIVFGPDGNLYVANQLSDSIQRFHGQTGDLIDEFVTGGSGGLDDPTFLTFGPDDNLYVSSNLSHQILRYDGETGDFMGVFAQGGGLNSPFGLVFGPDGNLYVASFGSGEVLRYHGSTGAFIDIFTSNGLGPARPAGIDFGPDGNLYVINAPSGGFGNNDSSLVSINGQTGVGIEILIWVGLGFSSLDLKFGPDDLLYVSNFVTNEVLRFQVLSPGRLSGSELFVPPGSGLNGAATMAFFSNKIPAEIWSRQGGTPENDEATVVVVGEDNSVYVAGVTEGTLAGQINAGGLDAFIFKYDGSGQLVCIDQFGTAGNETVSGINYEPPYIFLSGSTSGTFADNMSSGGIDAYVRQYDLNCNVGWTQQYGSSGDDIPLSGLGITPDGNSVFSGVIFDDGSGSVAQIQKLNAVDGNLACFGQALSLSPLDGIVLNSPMVSLAVTTSQDIFSGAGSGTGAEISQFDLNCNLAWSTPLGTFGDEYISGLGAGPEDANPEGLFVGGSTSGSFAETVNAGEADIFVQRYDYNTGILEWTRQFGTNLIEGDGIVLNSPFLGIGGTTTGAFFGFENAGGKDVFIRKYGLDGNEIWTTQFGTDLDDNIGSITKTPDLSSIIVVGNTAGAFPGKVNQGGKDFYVMKLRITSEPSDLLNALIDLVNDFNLHHGIANSLDTKLDAAKDSLNGLKNNRVNTATNALNAFISSVEAQRGKKITNAVADRFIADAQAIIEILNNT